MKALSLYKRVKGGETETKARVLLRFSNSPLALKVLTALRWRGSGDIACGIMQ